MARAGTRECTGEVPCELTKLCLRSNRGSFMETIHWCCCCCWLYALVDFNVEGID